MWQSTTARSAPGWWLLSRVRVLVTVACLATLVAQNVRKLVWPCNRERRVAEARLLLPRFRESAFVPVVSHRHLGHFLKDT